MSLQTDFKGSCDYYKPAKNYVNSAWHFVKFRGLPWQITVNSVADSQLKEINSAVQNIQHIAVSINIMPHMITQMADKASKQSTAVISNNAE